MGEKIVKCFDCDIEVIEDFALVVRQEPKIYKCIDCYLKSIK